MKSKLHQLVLAATFLTVAASAPAAVLVGSWEFDENSGNTAYDATANHLDGTIYNARYVAGHDGGHALDFNGSNTSVVVDWNPLLTAPSIGISLWFKARAQQPQYADILDKGHGWNSSPYHAGYVIQYDGNSARFDAVYGNGTNFLAAGTAPGSNFKDDAWHHLAVNLGAGGNDLYIDGVLQSHTPGSAPIAENNRPLLFGRHWNNVRFFNGLLDDIQLYHGTLTSADVARLYTPQSTTVPEPASLVLVCLALAGVGLARRRPSGA